MVLEKPLENYGLGNVCLRLFYALFLELTQFQESTIHMVMRLEGGSGERGH
jgi:hypothetical protein